jgi:asparagine synthase (glutamine-hydrolysing)
VCGIAGQVRSDGRAVEASLLEGMCEAIEHRGPDSRGIHADGPAGIGIQRLRVIDLETGDQPIFNEDRSVAVVLNGEIYNYRELRAELESRGHRFATKGDTEVIVHLYEELGPRCVERLAGMFAFAVWDAGRRRLVLARDRVGKKPLFYSLREGALSFSSEIRSLLRDPEVSRELDHGALDCYLRYQYVPDPMSAFRDARKLPPASLLVYEEGEAKVERYWRLRYDAPAPALATAEIHERIRELIREATRRRMIADVPLGVFLSGGIDSSTVVAAMAEASSEPVKTFSIGFEEADHSELPNARLVAERFGTDHHELITKPDAVSLIPKIARHYGEPFADSSSVPSFQVAEMTRREVTVALNGDGGDESFAGYDRYYRAVRAAKIAGRIPGPLRKAIAAAGTRSGEHGDPHRPLNRARRLARGLALSERDRYRAAQTTFGPADRASLYTDEFRDLIGDSPAAGVIDGPWGRATGDSLVDVLLEVDVNTYLPGNLLPKIDIACMAHSLEARSPFLDHELMEFAAALPGDMKLQGPEKKVVLRDALRGWIPDQILDGPKKGFALPMAGEWFRGELRGYITDVLTDPGTQARGFFERAAVEGLLEAHMSRAADNSFELWTLMMFEVWQREVVDAAVP